MPTANLTDRKIASLKSGNELVEWWDKSTPGFGIRVSPKGKKTWFVMYRSAGLRRRLKFGRYPEISLEKARIKARKALSDVSEGKDPAQEKKAQEALIKRERLEAKTFAQLAQIYIEEYAKLNKRSWEEDERIIEKLLKPEFGTLNVKEITRSHVRSFLRGMAAKTKVQANRAHACLRKIFNWAIKEEIVDMEGNPASGISSPGGREKPKERNLSDDEIKAVWNKLEQDSTGPKKALQLILLTGQRPGEVVGLPWEELNSNDSLWMLPGSRAKNGLANIVPLSTQALRIIEKQREVLESQRQKREKRGQKTTPSAFLFPCRHLTKDKPMTVFAIDQEAQTISQDLGIPGFTPHDLRRTCSTKLGEMLVPGHLIDRITNHKPTGITDRVYNKYDYLREKQEALNAWGARLLRIVSDLELVGNSAKSEA
jgi:integrase